MSDIVKTTISKEEIIGTVKKFIIDNFLFGQEDNPIMENDSFMGKGIIDSTGILELIDFLEEEYEIAIEDNELLPENLDSLSNIGRFVKAKLS